MDLYEFCRKLPKIELHAHLNGSLSRSTMIELQRYYADNGFTDKTNTFFNEFEMSAGDPRSFSDCFQVFRIAHNLTTTPRALEIATFLTLQEFQEDGCCYIELRSTPRNTEHMTKRKYIETLVNCVKEFQKRLTIITRLIISISRHSPSSDGEEIADLAIQFHKAHPDLVVGIELSGNPTVGKFGDFIPALKRARDSGLKVSLHCGEVCNPPEVMEMLQFKPERLGHGTCIHPQCGGSEEAWAALCALKLPVEICLTSNVNSKSTPDYESHHFKLFYESKIPLIICTDDKGVFATSLSQEYKICAEIFNLRKSDLATLSLNATEHIFDAGGAKIEVQGLINSFIKNSKL